MVRNCVTHRMCTAVVSADDIVTLLIDVK